MGVLEADAARRADQHIGHWGEPQAQLVGAHSVRRGAVGIEVELTFLDAVLHLAAGAVELFVEVAGLYWVGSPRARERALPEVAVNGEAEGVPALAPAGQDR